MKHVTSWTPHMEADQFGIKVSDEDALRILDFLNANARQHPVGRKQQLNRPGEEHAI